MKIIIGKLFVRSTDRPYYSRDVHDVKIIRCYYKDQRVVTVKIKVYLIISHNFMP